MAGGAGGQGAEDLREGQLLLGAPTFEELGNGRVRCVETGHELPSRDMAESYGRSKGCRLALIDSALAGKKPPLNMFKPDPLSKSKLICKLTGDTINKSEEHIWKHMTGKRFQNKLKKKEAEMETEMPASKGVRRKNTKRDKKKAGKVAADGHLKKNAKQVDIPPDSKQTIVKKNQAEDINENGPMSSKPLAGSRDSEEPDFWVPPIGSRWDFDDGKHRWEVYSNSSPGKDEDVCKVEDMVRGRRETSSGGRGEGSGRRFTSISTPLPSTSAPLPSAVGPTTSAPLPPTSAPLPLVVVGPTTSAPLPPTSAPLPLVVGPTTSAPLPPAVGPTTSAPLPPTSAPLPLVVGPTTSAPLPSTVGLTSPSHMASGSTPLPAESVRADDETSHHEGEGSCNETMRAVWINEGNKIEPAQASQFITKTIQAHFPSPIHRFSDFPMGVQDLLFSMFLRNHRFTEHSDELRARSAWTTTARANFKHLMYNVRKNAERACASTDKNRWKEHGPVWMRKEYWTELCNIWGAEKWNVNSNKAKQNRAAHPEANVHTSGSVSFATHKARLEAELKRPAQFQELFDETHKKKGTNNYISEKAREVAESYSRRMDERYGDGSQRPELDPDIWVAASGAPKKGHVYGFGHSLGMTRVLSSCSSSASHATSPFTTPAAPGDSSSAAPTMTPDMFRAIINETVSQNISTIVSQNISTIVSQTVSQMLAQLGIPSNIAPPASPAPPAQQPPDHPSRDVGRDDDQDDTYAEDL